jgi:hypothetical protein
LVLVSANHLPSNRPSRKLDQKWRGPFKVVKNIAAGAYKLDLPSHWKGHKVFNESRIKKFEELRFKNQIQLPGRPEPELVNDQNWEYKVCEVLKEQKTPMGTEYLIRWEGYGPEDDTWEPRKNLQNAQGAIQKFKAQG